MKTNKSIWRGVKDYLVMFAALLLYLFAYYMFIYYNNITSGGLAGLASVISRGFDIPFWVPYNVINLGLLILALVVIGWDFMKKTFFSIVVLAFGTTLMETYVMPQVYNPAIGLNKLPLFGSEIDVLLAVIIGGLLIGLSLGLVFSVNGSTGGTDIVAAIINKYKPISIGRAMFFIDIAILGSSYFIVPGGNNLKILIFSAIQVLITNSMIDFYLNGMKQSVQFFVVSQKSEEIANEILKQTSRGVTFLRAAGGYTNQSMNVVSVIARKTESTDILRIIRDIDPNAFTSQWLVNGVYGQGFETIKVSTRKKVTPTTQDGIEVKQSDDFLKEEEA